MRQPTRIPDRRPPAVPPDRTVPHAIARSAAPGPAAADAVRVPADPADPGGSAGTSRLSWGRTVAPGAGRPAISPAPDAATPDRAAVALRLSWRSKSRSVGAKPLSAGASPPSRRVPRGGGQTARIVPNWGRFRAAGGSTSFASARVGRLPGRSRSGWVSQCARVGRLLGRSGSGRVRKCPSWAVTGAIRLGPGPQVPELGGYVPRQPAGPDSANGSGAPSGRDAGGPLACQGVQSQALLAHRVHWSGSGHAHLRLCRVHCRGGSAGNCGRAALVRLVR